MKLKTIALTLVMVLAFSTLLCSCSKKTETTDTTETKVEETTTLEETTEETENTSTATSTSEETEITERTGPNGKDTTPYEEITLDGVKEHEFISTDYCYLESEKYVLFIDKDIKLPGDFADNLDAIIDDIEDRLQVPSCPSNYNYPDVADMTVYYGFNPWKDWYIGEKIPIFLFVDRKDEQWISGAAGDMAFFVMYELFTDEVWDSVPSYANNDWRRSDYIDYSTIAHELTHTVTCRQNDMTVIMTEGIAHYLELQVIDDLAGTNPSIKETRDGLNIYDYSVPEAINADNAEEIFISDYNELSHADRGAEYSYGKYLWRYLFETYGDDVYLKVNEKINEKNIDYMYGNYSEGAVKEYAEIFKELFGEDIFKEFGSWCVENDYLQEVSTN